jgi:hypothetical protein
MAELTAKIVLDELLRLATAFPSHKGMKDDPEKTAELYRDHLHGMSAEAVRAAVRITIENETFFPKVAQLRAIAWDWTRRNSNGDGPVEDRNAGRYCARCQSPLQWLPRWRPAVDVHGYAIAWTDDAGVAYVKLERYERLLCGCAAPCAYSPEPEFDDPWMRRDRIKGVFGRPRVNGSIGSSVRFYAPLSDERRAEMQRLLTTGKPSESLEQIGALAENMATEALEHG